MRKLTMLLLGLSLMSLTSCIDMLEELYLNKDGSGTYNITFDMSGLFSDPMMKGMLEEMIPSDAKTGILIFPNLDVEINFTIGTLMPLDENNPEYIKGIQQRLKSLGFFFGAVNGKDGEATKDAIKAFQKFCKDKYETGDPDYSDPGKIDGTCGPKTRELLTKVYGC